MKEEIVKKLLNMLPAIFGLEENTESISLDTPFSDLGIDSVSFIRLVVDAESEFDIELGDDDLVMYKFINVRQFVERILSIVDEK